jgi:hypothetical protein
LVLVLVVTAATSVMVVRAHAPERPDGYDAQGGAPGTANQRVGQT